MTMITRRHFLKYSAGASTALVLPWTVRQAFAAKPARSLQKYIQPLPVPGNGIVVSDSKRNEPYSFTQTGIMRQLDPHCR